MVAGGCAGAQPHAEAVRPTFVQLGAPGLRERARDVPPESIASPEFQALVQRMIAAMRAAPGVGLAAPQIGVPLRVFVLEDRVDLVANLSLAERNERERAPFAVRVFVNPTVTPVGDERVTFFEGCLSVDGLSALVPRAREVEVQGLDEHGAAQVWRVRGWPARILQHEYDHLNGTLYVDRMLSRSLGTAAQNKARFGGKAIAEVFSALNEPPTRAVAPCEAGTAR